MKLKKSVYVKIDSPRKTKQIEEKSKTAVPTKMEQLEIFAEILIDIYLKQQRQNQFSHETEQ